MTNSSSWVYSGTGFRNGNRVPDIVGNEADRYMPDRPLPDHTSRTILSHSPYTSTKGKSDHGNSSVYQAPSGAWVFAAGTFRWNWALDRPEYVDSRIQRTTWNVLNRFIDRTAPVVTGPAQSFPVGSMLGSSDIPVRLRWSATDNRSGVDRYQLQRRVNGGTYNYVSVPTRMTTSVTPLLERGHTYQFRVRARDRAQNWSRWKEGPEFKVLHFQESHGAIAYTGSWQRVALEGAYGGEVTYSTTPGNRASFAFTGRNVAWVAPKGTNRGQARVYVDGTLVKTVDLYSSSSLARRVVFSRYWRSSSSHTLDIEVVGTSGRPRVDIDAFVVLR